MVFSHEYFMHEALKEAHKAFEADEVPVGAVLVINNKIIARGHNQVELLNDATAHAEMLAVTAAFSHLGSKYLPEASLYVTVEPCLMCCGVLYWGKIGTIVYGATDEKNGYRRWTKREDPLEEVSPFHPKAHVIRGVLADECAAIMKEFFRQKR